MDASFFTVQQRLTIPGSLHSGRMQEQVKRNSLHQEKQGKIRTINCLPSNRVISSLEGKFGTVGDTFVLVLEPLFMKISNLCKNHLLMA